MPMSPRLLRPRASSTLVASDVAARAYINAVRLADGGQYMEGGVQRAIDAFVIGCKADGIWNAIKSSCILMGARTLSGALTPLVGTAPTNSNFVSGDYNRKTGLVGNGSSKYLATNRNNNTDPQNNQSMGVYVSAFGSGTNDALIGGGTGSTSGTSHILAQKSPTVASERFVLRSRGDGLTFASIVTAHAAGLHGISRSASGSCTYSVSGVSGTENLVSGSSDTGAINVFARDISSPLYATHRLAFYWVGEALSLSSMSSRLTTLYNAIGAAIP